MSVYDLPPEVYEHVNSKLYSASFRRACDIDYIWHATSLSTEEVTKHVINWHLLVRKSYAAHYREVYDHFADLFTFKPLPNVTTYQLLRWLETILYQIQIDEDNNTSLPTIDGANGRAELALTQAEYDSYLLLGHLVNDCKTAIIRSLPAYQICRAYDTQIEKGD